ncbi:phosphohydrolase [Bacteroidia bacterium]|nr:phosphohydrolase [Bacteroidia bacterium]GHU66807.1 phosphohydrolase [Bacteroidia bacterium]
MTAIEIIHKYYREGSELYAILVSHSYAVAEKALVIAENHPELSIDQSFTKEAALLHDIGIFLTDAPEIHCFGSYPYICHGYLGADLLRKEGWDKHALVCERHTGTGLTLENIIQNRLPLPHRAMLPGTIEEKLVCFADKFFSKSKPEKEKSPDKIRKSMEKYGADSVVRWDELVKLFLG